MDERNRAISEFRRLNDSIADPKVSAQIDRMEATTGKIIDAVVEAPAVTIGMQQINQRMFR